MHSDVEHLTPRLSRGDEHAYRELVGALGEPLFRYAFSLLHDPDAAEDAVQTCLIRLYKSRKRLREGSLKAYAYRITRNVARTRVRDRVLRSKREHESGSESTHNSPELAVMAREAWSLAQKLPGDIRDALLLHVGHGLTLNEAAEVLGIPRGTVSTRVRKGLEELRGKLTTAPVMLPALSEFQDAMASAQATPVSPPPAFLDRLETILMATVAAKTSLTGLVLAGCFLLFILVATVFVVKAKPFEETPNTASTVSTAVDQPNTDGSSRSPTSTDASAKLTDPAMRGPSDSAHSHTDAPDEGGFPQSAEGGDERSTPEEDAKPGSLDELAEETALLEVQYLRVAFGKDAVPESEEDEFLEETRTHYLDLLESKKTTEAELREINEIRTDEIKTMLAENDERGLAEVTLSGVLLGQDNSPISGATVEARKDGKPWGSVFSKLGSAMTDTDGRWRLSITIFEERTDGYKEGISIVVSAHTPDNTSSEPKQLVVTGGESYEDIILPSLIQRAAIAGRVVDQYLGPVGGAHVRAYAFSLHGKSKSGVSVDEAVASTKTDENGCFTLNGLRDGTYFVEVVARGCERNVDAEISVVSGPKTELGADILMKPMTESVRIKLVYAEPPPASLLMVRVTFFRADGSKTMASAEMDEDGYVLVRKPNGEVIEFQVSVPGYEPSGRIPVTLAPEGPVDAGEVMVSPRSR